MRSRMARFELSFIELHNPLFMQGSNLTNKVNAKQRGAILQYDTELAGVIIQFKGKAAIIPAASVASMDLVDISQIGIEAPKEASAPPAIARARRQAKEEQLPEVTADYDENDPEAAAAHRAAVRAASANSNRSAPRLETQNDTLIQQSRMVASGAQVSNPTRPVEGLTGVSGKPKATNHAQMRAQLAKEAKDVQ